MQVKQLLRNHPDYSDEQVAERLGFKGPDMDIIAVARRDLEAG